MIDFVIGTDDGKVILWDGGFAIGLFGVPEEPPIELDDAPYEWNRDVCTHAKSLLLSQYRTPRRETLLCIITEPFQRLERAMWDVMTRVAMLDNAEGEHLDLWGRILDVPRASLDDDGYRVRLRVRQLALRSSGSVPDLYQVLLTAYGDGAHVAIMEHYPATLLIDVGTELNADGWLYAEISRAAKPGGVKLYLTAATDDEQSFIWDEEPGELHGWGSTTDADMGGKLGHMVLS